MMPRPSIVLFALALVVSHTASAQRAPRAVPVDEDPPRAVPVEENTRRAQEVPEAPATPRPSGPDEDLFDYAMLAYSQKEYTIAAANFGQYLSTYPTGRHLAQALFRLGECYLYTQQVDEAARCYREVVNRFARDPMAPYAGLRLGVISYNRQDFKGAVTYFNFCESKSSIPALTLQAAYYRSMSLARLGDTKKQIEALKAVLAVKEKNEYRQDALLSLATAYQTTGSNKDALPILRELADSATDDQVRADAALKAAIILGEQQKTDEAATLYQQVLKTITASPEQRGAALVGYVSALYAKGDYDAVIDTYNRHASVSPPRDLQARLLMHVGDAQRMKKSYGRAVDMYNMIEQYHNDSPVAFEAAYWRTYCFYLLEDKDLHTTIAAFLGRYSSSYGDHEYINTARLLLADHHFNRQEYKEAAAVYQDLNITKLATRLRPSTLFHKGWSESEAARHSDAVATLTLFIKENATSPDLPKALAKRGLSAKENNDNTKALEDFSRIVKDFPKSEAVELAYYLSALIYEKQNNKKAMLENFQALLINFPTSAAAAEASFKSGVAMAEQKEFEKAISSLKQAIKLDATTYADQAIQRILLCYWAMQDVDNLAREVDEYRNNNANAVIPPTMLGFLGLKFFDRKDFHRSARYLTWASTPETPENTDSRIWNYLAQARLETKAFEEGLSAIDFFLKASSDSLPKARGFETMARLLIGLERFEDAVSASDEGLRIVKDGVVQGQLLIVQGDALLAAGDKLEKDGDLNAAKDKWQAAAGKYVVPSQVIDSPLVTPMALEKAVKALERLGDKTKADQLRNQLATKYPDYQAGQ
jgi:TolA-binding protein